MLGDSKNEDRLILRRNPYGSNPEAYKTEGTLESRLCKVISSALRYMNQNVEALFYEGKESEMASKDKLEEQIKLTEEAKGPIKKFFFGEEMRAKDYQFIKDNFDNSGGFAFELREARRRLMAGEKPPLFLRPIRIFEKNGSGKAEEERKAEAHGLDEDRIREIVDKRIEEKLSNLGGKSE